MYKHVKFFVIGVLALVGSVIFAANTMAANVPFCQAYAGIAVVQYQQMVNNNRQCKGFRWHNWYDGHYSWCLKVSENSANAETLIRHSTLQGGGC